MAINTAPETTSILQTEPRPNQESSVNERELVFDIFRRWGYLQAWLDPLGQYLPPEPFPVTVPEGEFAAEARGFYSGTFGVEFAHIVSAEQRQWLQERIEQPTQRPDQAHVLTQLIRADIFEQVIQSRYLGHKALFVGRVDGADPVSRPDTGDGCGNGRREGADCDESSRALERDDEYDWPAAV